MKSLLHGFYEQLINTHPEEKLREQGITISRDPSREGRIHPGLF